VARPDDLPAALRTIVGDQPGEVLATTDGSDHIIRRYESPSAGPVVVKRADGRDQVDRLDAEASRLAWLAGHLPVPEVVALVHEPDAETAWLVSRLLPGSPADELHHRVDGHALATAFAAGLRAIHALDASACPFDARLPVRAAEARQRVAAGLVDAAGFDEAYRRYDPDTLLGLWLQSVPGDEDPVVTHGRYTLDNVLIDAGGVTGYVDWARCGVADRYVDLALAARSLARAVGPELVVTFFEHYGIDQPSLAKIDFYVLADELLR
jgi:aminoglycoside 3'-phosphotransferase-1